MKYPFEKRVEVVRAYITADGASVYDISNRHGMDPAFKAFEILLRDEIINHVSVEKDDAFLLYRFSLI